MLTAKADIQNHSFQVKFRNRMVEPMTRANNLNLNNSQGQKNIERKKLREYLNPREEKLIAVIERTARSLIIPKVELQFSVNERDKEISITVVDTTNHEIIRRIPLDQALDMGAKIDGIFGLFVDIKA